MSTRPKVFLIDGSGYIFRAYYAIRPLSTREGLPTNAVIGFARMIGKLLREKKPAYLGMVFDSPQKTFRHKIYDLYKANRDAPPEDLIPQFELVRQAATELGFFVSCQVGYEADDLMATLAARCRHVEDAVGAAGQRMTEVPPAELEARWQAAKQALGEG